MSATDAGARTASWVVSCPCGGWIRRTGVGFTIHPDVEQFLWDHDEHCRCDGTAHRPHVDRTLLGIA